MEEYVGGLAMKMPFSPDEKGNPLIKRAVVVSAIFLTGCASRPSVIAEWSTYPNDRVVEVVEQVSVVPNAGLHPGKAP